MIAPYNLQFTYNSLAYWLVEGGCCPQLKLLFMPHFFLKISDITFSYLTPRMRKQLSNQFFRRLLSRNGQTISKAILIWNVKLFRLECCFCSMARTVHSVLDRPTFLPKQVLGSRPCFLGVNVNYHIFTDTVCELLKNFLVENVRHVPLYWTSSKYYF